MPVELARRILAEAYVLGAREAGFYLDGEPLLHPKLDEMLLAAKAAKYEHIYLTTNGALATPTRQEGLIRAGLNSIKYSINAGTRANYLLIHGVDDFSRVLEHLEYSLSRRTELAGLGRRFVVTVSAIRTPGTAAEIELLMQTYASRVDDFVVMDKAPRPQDPDAAPQAGIIPCAMVFNRFHVTADGYFTACCIDANDDLILADLNRVTLKEAWEGGTAQQLRERHLSGWVEGSLCGRCKLGGSHPYGPLARSG